MRRIFILLCLLILPLAAQTPSVSTATAIRHVLERQRDAWNRGDLNAFMKTYWHSPKLVFYGVKDEYHGWQAALERYRRTYGSHPETMGHLEFSNLTVVALGKDGAACWGHWHLRMADGTTKQGLFTLVLRRFPEGWRIIHDHSS